MTGSRLSAEVITTRGGFARCADEWDTLFAQAANPHPWRRHAWLMLAWRRGARVVIVRDAGRPVMAGAFLLCLHRLRPIVTFLHGSIPQTDDVLHVASPEIADQADLLLRTLVRGLWPARQLRISRLPESSPLCAAPCLRDGSVRIMGRHQAFHVAVSDHESFDAYMRSRTSNLRHDHSRRLRRMSEAGPIELRREPGRDAGATLGWLLERKRQWLSRTQTQAPWLSGGGVDRFLSQLQQVPEAATWSVWSLRVGGIIAAALLIFEEKGFWVSHIIAQDPAFNAYSPGRTIKLLTLERAFDEGVSRIEMGISGAEWKRRLAVPSEMILTGRFQIK